MRRFSVLMPLTAVAVLAGAVRRGSVFDSLMSAALGMLLVTLVRHEHRPFEAI